jgi:hypothetical protein
VEFVVFAPDGSEAGRYPSIAEAQAVIVAGGGGGWRIETHAL